MFERLKGKQFDRLRKLLRDKKISKVEYHRLASCELTFVGIIQRCGWRKVLKERYRGYYAVRRLYLESAA